MVVIPNVLTDHPSLLGIVRMPKCTYKTNEAKIPILSNVGDKWVGYEQPLPLAEWIKSGNSESKSYSVSKSKHSDFYPYTYYVLTDGEAEPLVLHPQYLPSSFTIKGKFALSHQPVERYYPSSYKGSKDGVVYNITNVNQMMLPTGTNEGLAYLQSNASSMYQNQKNQKYDVIAGGINSAAGAVSSVLSGNIGGAVSGAISGITNVGSGLNAIKATNARNKDILATPSSISNWGNVSTRTAFGTNNVRLLKYSVRDVVKTKINNFVKRYGSKYNSYSTINHKTYKGYLKMIEPDIDSGIDNIYIQQIKNILERGIFFE